MSHFQKFPEDSNVFEKLEVPRNFLKLPENFLYRCHNPNGRQSNLGHLPYNYATGVHCVAYYWWAGPYYHRYTDNI
eukprot:342232-Amorphochlora_amoeboformis.AAC.1